MTSTEEQDVLMEDASTAVNSISHEDSEESEEEPLKPEVDEEDISVSHIEQKASDGHIKLKSSPHTNGWTEKKKKDGTSSAVTTPGKTTADHAFFKTVVVVYSYSYIKSSQLEKIAKQFPITPYKHMNDSSLFEQSALVKKKKKEGGTYTWRKQDFF